jgi:hypothetical protein
MTLECINPEDLPAPSTYAHVVVATASRLVFVAGQEPEDEHGNLVGVGDLAVQTRRVFANVGRAALFGDHKPAATVVGRRGAGQTRIPDRGRSDRGDRQSRPACNVTSRARANGA